MILVHAAVVKNIKNVVVKINFYGKQSRISSWEF